MSLHDYDEFAAEFCALLGAAVPLLAADHDGLFAFHGLHRELEFGVSYNPVTFGSHAVVHVVIGRIPCGSERQVIPELLAANLNVGVPGVAFGLSAETGDVVLRMNHRFGHAGSAASLLEALQVLETAVLRWRTDPDGLHFSVRQKDHPHA